MSKTVDERVVSMKFDNKNFENNVKTSLSTLEKLKQSLKLKDASEGLKSVSAAAKKVDLSPISESANKVGLRFSAMYTMADQAFRNMYNSASMYAKRIISAFTTDPIKSGFQEYETQINAVQTILANTQSKGTTLDDVNVALDTLNKYADKTIYNFTEMTRNIGTFTAAGVDLDTSVNAIQGIANLAAVSGSNAQQASTAMYQLSQALAAGTVKLMDWNSVVNAGMGGQVFQDALKETARVHGVAIDEMIKEQGSFRETLSEGWITTDILTETLWKFTLAAEDMDEAQRAAAESQLKAIGYTDKQIEGIFQLGQTATDAATKVKTFTQLMDTLKEAAQSGWTQTWEYIVGDFEGAKTLWTGVSDTIGEMINKSSDARNKVVEGAMTSSWDKLVKKINKAGIETSTFEDALHSAAKEMGVDLDGLVEKHGSLEAAFKKTKGASNIVTRAIEKLNGKVGETTKTVGEAVTYTVKEGDTLSEIAHKYGMTWKELWELNKNLIKDPDIIGNGWVIKIKDGLTETTKATDKQIDSYEDLVATLQEDSGRELLIESLANAFEALKRVITPIGKAFRSVFKPLTSDKLYGFLESFRDFTAKLRLSDENFANLKLTFQGFFSVLDMGWTVIKKVAGAIGKLFGATFPKIGGGILSVTGKFGLWLSKLRDGVNDTELIDAALGKVGDALKWVGGKVYDFTKSFIELPEVQNGINKLKEGFSGIGKELKSRVSGGIERFKEFLKSLKNVDLFSLESIGKTFERFKTNVIDYFLKREDGSSIFDGIISAAKNLWSSVTTYLGEAGVKFDEIKDKIVGFLVSVKEAISENIGGIAAIGTLVGLFALIWKAFDAIKNFTAAFSAFEGFGDFINELSDGVKRLSKAMAFRMKAEAIKSIATAIAILAGSLIALTMVDQTKLLTATGALVTLTFALGLLAFSIGKISDLKDLGKLTGTLLGLAGAVLILSFAAKILGGMNPEQFMQAAIAIGAFMGAIIILSQSTKASGGDFSGFGKMMLQLGGALLILAFVTKIFGSMDTKTLIQGGAAVIIFLGAMVGMMAATNLLAKDIPKFAGMMLGLGAALLLMSVSIAILGNMDVGTLLKGGAAVAIFLGAMVGMMAATNLLAKDMPKFGMAMFGISAGLLAMAFTVKILGSMDMGTIVKGTLVMGAFMGLVSALMWATNLLGKNSANAGKFGLMILSFAGAMLLLTASIAVLSLIKPEALDNAVGAIIKVGVLFGALMIVTKFAQSIKLGTIIGLAAGVAILAVSLAALSFIDGSKLQSATIALSVVIGMFAILVASTKFVNGKALGVLIVMTGAVALIAGVLYLLSSLEVGSAIGVAASLSMLILSLSGACLMLSLVPVTGALTGVASLAILIAGVGVIMAAIAGLTRLFPGMEDFLNESLPVLESIGYALGSFFGNIVGGFAEGATSGLPEIATNLTTFMDNLSGFIAGAKTIDQAAIDGVKGLATMMLSLTGASLLDSITSWLTGGSSVADFAAQLIPFGNAIVSFSSIVSGSVNEEAVTAAANAGKIMAEMAKTLPNSGGVVGFFAGENDMSTFATQLVPFGNAIVSFSSIVAGNVNEEAVTAAANAGKAMAEMATTIPNTGGLVAFFAGDNDMATFGTQLVAFGGAIKSFSESVTGLDTEAITTAASAGTALTTMAETIPNTGGLISFFTGDNDMATFGSQLVLFGGAIKSFSETVTGIDVEAVNTAASAGSVLADMANKLPESGGLLSVFTADNDMSTFAKEIKKFGEGIADFSEEVSGINTTAVDSAASAGATLASMANKLVAKKIDRLGDFGDKIKSFGGKLKSFATNTAELNAEKFSAIATGLSDLAAIKVKDADGLQSFVDSLGEIGVEGIDKFVDAFSDSAPKVLSAVSGMFDKLIASVHSKRAAVTMAFRTVFASAIVAIKSQYSGFYSAGSYLVDGFAAGISANTFKATAKARAMALAALEAAKDALGIESPSKEFYEAGMFTGEGFINALSDYEYKTYKAGESIAEAAKSGLTNAIYKVQNLIENGIDSQPTIRPVLDLSNVTAGVNSVNGMLSMNPSIGMMARVGSISSMMNGRQNGSSDDVVSAIKDLGRKLGTTSGDTYNVNGVTYDDGSNINDAVETLVRAAKIERRR